MRSPACDLVSSLVVFTLVGCGASATDSSKAAPDSSTQDGVTPPAETSTPDAETPVPEASCVRGAKACDGLVPTLCSASGALLRGAPCPFSCASGSCVGTCVPGAADCDPANSTALTCTAAATFGPQEQCASLCVSGACVASCITGASSCAGSRRQICREGTTLDTAQVCPFVCSAGTCAGECVPGSVQCARDGKTPQSCSANGAWVSGDACPGACSGGTCVDACPSGASQCSGSARLACAQSGAWTLAETCPFVCVDGACQGVCTPGETTCAPDGRTPQTCSARGLWVDAAPCPHSCASGKCEGPLPDAGPDTGADSGEFDAGLDAGSPGPDALSDAQPQGPDVTGDAAAPDAATDASFDATLDAPLDGGGTGTADGGQDSGDLADAGTPPDDTGPDVGAGTEAGIVFPDPLYDCDLATPSARRSVQLPWNPAAPNNRYKLAMHRTQSGQVYIIAGNFGDPILAYRLDLTQPGTDFVEESLPLFGSVLSAGPYQGGLGVLVDSVATGRRLELVPISEGGIGASLPLTQSYTATEVRDGAFRETAQNDIAVTVSFRDAMGSGSISAGRFQGAPTALSTVTSTPPEVDYQIRPGAITQFGQDYRLFVMDNADSDVRFAMFRFPASGTFTPDQVSVREFPRIGLHGYATGHAPFGPHTLAFADYRNPQRTGFAFLPLDANNVDTFELNNLPGHWLVSGFGGLVAEGSFFRVFDNKEHFVAASRSPDEGSSYLNFIWVATDGTLYGRRAGDPGVQANGAGFPLGSAPDQSAVSVVFTGGPEESISVAWVTVTNLLEYDTIRCVKKP